MFSGQEHQTRDALIAAGRVLLDECILDVAAMLEGRPASRLFVDPDVLPPKYSGLYDVAFAKRFLVTLSTVCWKIAADEWYPASSVAEEIALDAVIYRGLDHATSDALADQLESLRDAAFEDRDFEWLWDASADGIEDTPVAKLMGMCGLRLAEWFDPFGNRGHVHPSCA
jgi:hypothetical protein